MKSTFIIILLALCLIVFLCIENIIPIPFTTEWASSLQAIGALGTLIVSLSALVYAIKEYVHHKESEKTSLLCQYFNRFVSSESIRKVTDYIIETSEKDEAGNIIGFDNKKTAKEEPRINEFELFMHFFEEIQLHIDNKMIDEKVAGELFGYYAGVFHKYKDFHKSVTDYDDKKIWCLYLKFVNNYLEKAKEEDNHK